MASPSKERENESPLLESEIIWRGRYTMLESHGYRLRQRYKPDWKPTWLKTNRPLLQHEDYNSHNNPITMDAVRISDGRPVFLKRVQTDSSELVLHRFLSDPQRLSDSANHTVALIDEFTEDDDPHFTYMVLPLLRLYYHPEFFFVDEAIDFIRQLLEGLIYMHRLNVAHRDCSDLNIMMDAESMYPKGFHPVSMIMDASGVKRAQPRRRRDAGGVRYYFIDFEISSRFGPDDDRRVVGIFGQDHEIPELSATEPYDPFFVDIFIIGNFIKKRFLLEYTNLSFLEPLVEEMTERFWMNRCNAMRALKVLDEIVAWQSRYSLRWELKKRDAGRVTHFFQDISTISREATILARTIVAARSKKAAQFLRGHLKLNKTS